MHSSLKRPASTTRRGQSELERGRLRNCAPHTSDGPPPCGSSSLPPLLQTGDEPPPRSSLGLLIGSQLEGLLGRSRSPSLCTCRNVNSFPWASDASMCVIYAWRQSSVEYSVYGVRFFPRFALLIRGNGH